MADRITVRLSCGHTQDFHPAFPEHLYEHYVCKELVDKEVTACEHIVKAQCGSSTSAPTFVCTAQCGTLLECGHPCNKPCYACRQKFKGRIIHESHGRCDQVCGQSLDDCNHLCGSICHGDTPCPPCQARCPTKCSHRQCTRTCSAPCLPCDEDDCRVGCEHSKCTLPCGAPCNWIPCSKRCEKLLRCGHRCPSFCGELCPSSDYCQTCASEDVLENEVDLTNMVEYSDINLEEEPCLFLSCGHFFTHKALDLDMKLSTYYEMDNSGHPTAMHDQAIPLDLSLGDIGCPLCKEIPLSSSRYAVPARIALLVTSTRRVADAAQYRHTNLLNTLSSLATTLHSTSPYTTFFKSDFSIVKPTKDILDLLCRTFDTTRSRYEPLYQLHNHITTVLDALDAPFWQIQQLLITSNTDRGLARFEIDPLRNYHGKSRTRLLCLQLRTVLAILSDYLNITARTPALSARDRTFDSRLARQECNEIMDNAAKAGDYAHEVEGNLLWICFAVLQLSHCMATREDGKRYDELRREAKVGLLRVQKIMRARGKETEEMVAMMKVVEQLVGYVERGEGVGVDLTRVLVPAIGLGAMGGSQSQTGAVDVGRSHGVGTAKGKENVASTGQGVEELKEKIRRLMM